MALAEKQAGPTALTTSAATIVTGATTPTRSTILVIIITNIHTSTVGTFEISIATSTTVSTATAIYSVVPVPPNSTLIIRGPITLPSATNLNMKASANSVFVATVSYYENL